MSTERAGKDQKKVSDATRRPKRIADSVSADFDPLDAARRFFAAQSSGHQVWLVGGRVRDALLGRSSLDTDIAVSSGAMNLAARLADATGGSFVALDRGRDIARVVWRVSGRKHDRRAGLDARELSLDIKSLDGGSLETDLAARDFTINAFALPLSDGLRAGVKPDLSAVIDLHGGLEDLDARRIRMLSPASFDADPLRLLRAPRIAIELGFDIEPTTRTAILVRASRATEPAAERVRDEVLRLLAATDPNAALELLTGLHLLPMVFPELTQASQRPFGTRKGPRALDVALAALECAVALEDLSQSNRVRSETAVDGSLWLDLKALSEHLADTSFEGRPKALWLRLAALLAVTTRSASARYDFSRGGWAAVEGLELMRPSLLATADRLRLSAAASEWLTTVVAHAGMPERIRKAQLDPLERVRAIHHADRRSGGRGFDVALVAILLRAAERVSDARAHFPEVATPGTAELATALLATVMPANDVPPINQPATDLLQELMLEEESSGVLMEFIGTAAACVVKSDESLIDGRGLMTELDLEPGPMVGRIIDHLAAESAIGTVCDRDEALSVARRLLIAERAET